MVSVYGFLEMDSLWQALCPFTWYEEKPGFGLHHVKLQFEFMFLLQRNAELGF